jgi:polar amino acid transport system substrate-binding protein
MKYLGTVFISLLIMAVCLPVPAAAQKVAWYTDDTPGDPYIIGAGAEFKVGAPGIEIELYRKVGQLLGLDIEFKRIPWSRCLDMVEKGQIDAVFPTSFKKSRLAIGVYPMRGEQPDKTRKTRDNSYHLYKLKGSALSWTGKKIINVKEAIGLPVEWAVNDDIKKTGVRVIEMPVQQNILDMLLAGRIEGFVCLETVFDAWILNNPEKYKDIVKVSPPIWEKPYFLMMSRQWVKKHPKLARKIWDTIAELKRSGFYKGLLKKYQR